MMLYSAEIRWFFPQALPDEVLHWFSAGRALAAERAREDDYLLFPDCDTVGVKLREGKLEIKARLSAARPLSLESLNGRMDQWVKWSFADRKLQTLDKALHQAGRWLQVRKERYLRKFSADIGYPVEVAVDQKPLPDTKDKGQRTKDNPDSGCNVELVRLTVQQAEPSVWFSLGFEAFGPPAATVKILDDTLRHFLKAHSLPAELQLSGRESLSYPAWLATLV